MVAPSPSAEPRGAKYERLIALAREAGALATVVVHPCDDRSLGGAVEAAKSGLIRPMLVGPEQKIASLAAAHGYEIAGLEIVEAIQSQNAAETGEALSH